MVSGRGSGRVVEAGPDGPGSDAEGVNSGAEGLRPSVAPSRIGRQELARIRSSLADRDWLVLRGLDACGYLTTLQVERGFFRGTGLTPLSAARMSRRTLRRLHRDGIVRHLDRRIGGVRAGSASFIWTLTDAGRRVVDGPTRRRRSEPGGPHVEHALAVADVVVGLHEAARNGVVQLVAIETEPTSWRQIAATHGGRELLKPDLKAIVAVGEYEFHAWVEVDRDTEHRPTLRRKAEAYLRAVRDGSEAKWANVTPRVVWLVPGERRAEELRQVLAATGAPEGLFLVADQAQAVEALSGRLG